jgi:flagellin
MLSLVTNEAALIASDALGANQNNLNTTIQQLSTGERIVNAAIDPAGLAVALEMSGLLGSLGQASTNASNAQGMLQTADGALQNIGNVLTTMQQLASEAADGTINNTQRSALNSQFTQLFNEINNIAQSSQFNGIGLLQGANTTFQVGPNNNSLSQLQIGMPNVSAAGLLNSSGPSSVPSGTEIYTSGSSQNLAIADPTGSLGLLASGTGNAADTGTANTVATTAPTTPGDKLAVASPAYITLTVTKVAADSGGGNDVTFALADSNGGTGTYITVGKTPGMYVNNLDSSGLDFGFSSTNGYTVGQTITLSFYGSGSLADISTQTNAQSMITATTNALATLAGYRGNVGAYEQDLSTVSANLSSEQQNLTSALSNIQDANVAQTFATFTKEMVLQQAGISVLKQADSIPQQLATLFP